MLAIKNTNQDFLKVSIPENCALWSTTVAGKSVRPSVDKDKKILIPLKRSASETVFSAEIVYLASAAEMKRSGEVSMEVRISPLVNKTVCHFQYTHQSRLFCSLHAKRLQVWRILW